MGRNEHYVKRVKWPDDGSIKAAAIRNGNVIWALPRPYRHHDVIEFLVDCVGREPPIGPGSGYEQGFIGPSGEFLTREQAAELVGKPGKLFSEDIW